MQSHQTGTFQISFFSFSPTELRILLAIGNLAVLVRGPYSGLWQHRWLLFDVGGAIGIVGMLLVFLVTALKNGAQLYREEKIRGRPARHAAGSAKRRSDSGKCRQATAIQPWPPRWASPISRTVRCEKGT